MAVVRHDLDAAELQNFAHQVDRMGFVEAKERTKRSVIQDYFVLGAHIANMAVSASIATS
jgi:hypothetical protein